MRAKTIDIKKLRKKMQAGKSNSDDVEGIALLEKIESLNPAGWISRLISWWAIAEITWNIGKKIHTFFQSTGKTEKSVSFAVEEGTSEYEALMSLAAVYLDKSEGSSPLFRLEKNSSETSAFKPLSECTLNFKNTPIFLTRKVPDEPVNSRTKILWIVLIEVSVLKDFLGEFDRYINLAGNITNGIYRWGGWSWKRSSDIPENRVVILPKGQMDSVVNDARKFLNSKAWYFEKGIPWRKGYGFFGLPGTGKTSMAICLAINLSKSIYCISSKECSSEDFDSALRKLPEGAIVLIEDIDCIFTPTLNKRKRKDRSVSDLLDSNAGDQMTLSDFLNAVDGVTSHQDGRILILTTNHVDRLDPAIVRPGRIDVKIDFKHADPHQLNLISQKMLGEKEGVQFFNEHFKNLKTPITMAEAENLLLPIALKQIEEQA